MDSTNAISIHESVEAAVRADIATMPHLVESGLAALALALAKAMDRKTTSLLAKELRDTLADLKAVEAPVDSEASDLDRIRTRRAARKSA